MKKKDILARTDFGHRIAEEEAVHLRDYFVQTNQWRSVFSGDVDVVYGAKGAGKSAIYSLLLSHNQQLRERGIYVLAAENPRGTTVFRELVTDPPTGEEEFRALWKLYFLCLVGNLFRSLENLPDPGPQIIRKLEECRLLPPDGSLGGMLRSALDYVRRAVRADSLGVGVEFNEAGIPSGIIGKITLREPSSSLREAGLMSVDDLLKQAAGVLGRQKCKIWILLDRLDVAFVDSDDLECSALRALFRVYLDLVGLKEISFKIFLRSDIWSRIRYRGGQGFREASHIVRHTTISWSAQSLLNLVVRRLLHNDVIRSEFSANPEAILADTNRQVRLFSQIFPPQASLDWMLSRLRDGSRQTAPRELIHFLHCAKDIQLRKLELGGPEPGGATLFDFRSLKQSLPEVSQVRFDQTLCAEYPQWRPHLMRIKGESARLSLPVLAKIWQKTVEDAATIAENLVEIGVFQKQGTRDDPQFWIPHLYQDALEIKGRDS